MQLTAFIITFTWWGISRLLPLYLTRRRRTFSSCSIELALRRLRCLCTFTFHYDLYFRRSQKDYRFL
ncbi:unnamed protein product [Acanthoscelides obtectus]|uniref:Uncharacterized protein n=1 Tax=Acanthoscelides obtectus TaxID=200917 RepID=A0A9P0NXC9_ACAOB|nr:unnamed protein product [Acanthoscelides obtectus]CAK1642230.1 hypothetical protein AOBTE_LOCUS12906 [Acanthoscelides obtectus]